MATALTATMTAGMATQLVQAAEVTPIQAATQAVEAMEKNPTGANIDKAYELVQALKAGKEKDALNDRIVKVASPIHAAAHKAVLTAQEKGDLKDVATARKLVVGLPNIFKQDKWTWSASLDKVTLSYEVKVHDTLFAINKGSKEVKQATINELKILISGLALQGADNEGLNKHVLDYSGNLDTIQMDYFNAVLEEVKAAKTLEELEAAKEKYNDLLTMNDDALKEVAEAKIGSVIKAKEVDLTVVKVKTLGAIGAKKLKVTFSKPVEDASKLALTVKRDNVKLTITTIEWNEDKTEATLTASYNLQDGKYSVTSVYDKQEATTVENVEVKAAKVSKISFTSENAVLSSDKKSVTTKIKVENQYGEDVTSTVNLADLSISSSKGTAKSLDKGVLTIIDTADFAIDQKVVITAVHKATATVSTATLNVTQTANVKSIEIGEIATDNKDLQGKDIYVSTMANNGSDFYLPLTVKDQYGNVLSASELQDLTVISSNDKVVKLSATKIKEVNKKSVIALDKVSTGTHGTAVITVVSPSGVSANIQVTVLENGKVDVLTLEQPEAQLKQGVKTTVPFTAVDQYGNALVSADQLSVVADSTNQKLTINGNTTISVTGGTLSTKVDYANNKKLSLELTPAVDSNQVIVTVITATGKVQNVTWNVASAPKSTNIAGLSSLFYNYVQVGQTSNITDRIRIADQYGDVREITADMETKIVKVDDNANVTISDKTFTAVTKGTTKYKVQLIEKASGKVVDEYEFTMEAVDLKDITEFGITALNKHYTGAVSEAHDQKVGIYGKKGSNKVKVNQELIKDVSVTGGLTVSGTTLKSTEVNTNNADRAATLTVLVEGATAPITLTKEVKYNSAAPKAQSIDVMLYDYVIEDPVVELSKEEIKDILTTNAGHFQFYLEDQYAVASEDVKFTVTNIVDADTDASALSVTIAADGAVNITDTKTAGDSFVINAVTSTGITKSIKVILND